MTDSLAAHFEVPSLWSEQQTTTEGDMRMHPTGDEYTDWGDRAVYWIFSQRFYRWPVHAIAKEMGESEHTLKTWSKGTARPDRAALQRLRARYGKEGFSSFVFGEPCVQEVTAVLQEAISNIIRISEYIHDRKMAEEARALAGKAGAPAHEMGRKNIGKVK